MKAIARNKLDKLEDYAIKSDVARKIAAMIYRSDIYNFISKKINQFKNIKMINKIRKNNVPEHVAIIMDGNRRFAYKLGLRSDAGHEFGRDKLEEVLDWCLELGIKNLTVYAFSTENFKRSQTEVEKLMKLCKKELNRAFNDSRIHKNKVRIRILGKVDSLPNEIATMAKEIMEETEEYDNYSLNIALAYGGREEIIHAIREIADDVKQGELNIKEINEPLISKYLYTNGLPDPDLILRTSGEERISNFLLWQLAYSELYFSDVYWPAFQKKDFLEAIQTCQQRKRRFGK